MNIQNVLLKVWRAIRDFVARHIDSGVARESKKTSCAALRSNASRKACGSCTSRALLSLFVASATLLATFVIAPAYALSAGENTTFTEKTEGAKADSTKNDGESNKQSEQSESNNTEPSKKDTGSSSTLKKNDNKESKPVEKQNSDSNKVDDKAKLTEAAVNKKAKDAKKKGVDSTEAANGTDRSAEKATDLSEECKNAGISELAKCYVAKYEFKYKNKYVSYANITKPDESYTGEPKFYRVTKLSNNGDPSKLINVSYDEVKGFVKSFSLEGIVVDEKLLDLKKEETKKFVEVNSTSGAVTIRPNNWLKKGYYDVYVKVDYKDNSALTHLESCTEQSKCKVKAKGYEEYLQFRVKIRYNDTKNNNVLLLKVYNHQKAEGRTEVDDVPFTLNKDGKFNPSTIFIDSQSSGKFNRIYHRMICHKDSDSDYYLNSINNDLTLSDSDVSGSAKSSTQKQWEHRLGNRTSGSVLNDFTSGELYENDGDSIGERSQSWIAGTPNVGSEGKYTCRVFAINDANFSAGKKVVSESYVDLFDSNAKDKSKLKSAFDNPMDAFGNNKESLSKKKGIDWDYKTITIQFGDKPKPPKIGDNDLTLNVYPFKNDTSPLPAALTSDNNKISAMLGMELKPFIDATSAADSKNKITLRVLCSKGEKKKDNAGGGGASTGGTGSAESGSAGSGSSGGNTDAGSTSSVQSGSQPAQTSESSQPAENLEYKTWSSKPDGLVLSVPADDNQNTCHSNKEGEKTCVSVDPKTNVAARTDKEVSIKPTDVGNYQCVVFALKPKARDMFDGAINKLAQSGSLTPDSIKSALTTDPAAFKENKDFATFTLNLHSVSNFTLPQTGGQSWNLQLGILAALLVNLLAAGFVVSQSERGRAWVSATFNRTVFSGFDAQDYATSSVSNRALKRTPASTRVNAHSCILNSVRSREANSIRSRVRDCVFACNRFYKDFCAVTCSGVRSVKDFIRWVTERWRC
ncbi:hypothetical protein [Gardnerella vaginalis]|uniref:hypothetical protein n=1 Tax=Gardnerella vaginalis TaxID=2702 RepID=UPI001F0C16AF|nr:hypothetical protein [Gardnerella vaginalis]